MKRFTEEQIEAFRRAYPKGFKAVRYMPFPHKGKEYDPQNFGTVIGVNDQGVQIEWDFDGSRQELRQSFVTNSVPGVDRFELDSGDSSLVSLSSLRA